jgi:hypothetical protein
LLAKSIREIGAASLRNYMYLASGWFSVNFEKFNFFLIPLSFHGVDNAELSKAVQRNQHRARFLEHVEAVKRLGDTNQESDHYVTLNIQVRVVRSGSPDAIPVRWTNDPNAPAMTVKEEDILRRYPMNYSQLTKKLRETYADFKENSKYHGIRKPLENEKKYCIIRFLDPASARSGRKKFYNPDILKVFDDRYNRS